MKNGRLFIGISVLNAVLLGALVVNTVRGAAAQPAVAPVLRARTLEIVDDSGRVRAAIHVYDRSVVLNMGDPRGAPGVKLVASSNGSGLGLSSGVRLPNGRSAGIELHADDSRIVVRDKAGRERVFTP
jgi:hypothetical protein